ncbi:MAG TPA: hypothetical protein PLN33_03355 [Hyphomonadaceae bacterium]|jgi:hypothetical protein|nr:hypothetical protein [Hyphomonadaceae bacterium]HPN07460.1 hypothetical protein [Hyphomonadaceae bacterium]
MSADATGAIGPVSVRYAAQIRELLYAQAMQRMAADQEAARANADAERAARHEPKVKEVELNAKIDPLHTIQRPEAVKPSVETTTPVADKPKAADTRLGQYVDIQA